MHASPATPTAEQPGKRRHERGQGLVELALVMPLFMILVFGVIDFGMGLRAYITAAQAVREGARFAAVGNPAGTFTTGGTGDCNGSTTTTTVGKVCSTMDGLSLANISNVSVTYPNGKSPGNTVHVAVTYNYQYITPIRRLVNFLSAGTLGSSISMTSSVDMRIE